MDTETAPAEHAEAYALLRRADPVMDRLVRDYGTLDPFEFPDGGRTLGNNFAGMVLHIVAQQISIGVALIIYDRLVSALGGVPTPEGVLGLSHDELRALGMSNSKAEYLRSLAEAVLSGELPIDSLDAFSDEDVASALVRVKGVGPWSAEMFLIHQLRRMDILPAGDLGIRTAIQRAYSLPAPPTVDEARRLGEAWSPYRSLAAAMLWRSLR